jgi:hypothetical protein
MIPLPSRERKEGEKAENPSQSPFAKGRGSLCAIFRLKPIYIDKPGLLGRR